MRLQQRHLDELVTDYTGRLIDLYSGCERATESPIEALMMWAMFHAFRDNSNFGMASGNEVPDAVPEPYNLFLIRQARIGSYKADFAILSSHASRMQKFVVECDGHDFHERTKEQAQRDRSRDRFMTDAGWRVFRFTGSEIYRSPLSCAQSVLQSVWTASYDD